MTCSGLQAVLEAYQPQTAEEERDLARLRALARAADDPWTRASALHVTGSAVVVHPPSRRVLLRWHERMQAWLQVGGHADPGESDPYTIALREACEETGLSDLTPWPDPLRPTVLQVAVVPVFAGKGEPEHEHGDIRYGLSTRMPDAMQAESESAQLMWLSIEDALEQVGWDNLRVCLSRIKAQLDS